MRSGIKEILLVKHSGVLLAAGFSFLHLEANFAFARDDRRVLLVLLMAVAGIILGVGFYHESIGQVAICINIVLAAGYAGVLALNAYNRKIGD